MAYKITEHGPVFAYLVAHVGETRTKLGTAGLFQQLQSHLFFQSKTLALKNKNKIFQKFLSPFIKTTYKQNAKKNSRIFDSNVHTRLIIEGGFFLPSSAANLTRNRGPKPTI